MTYDTRSVLCVRSRGGCRGSGLPVPVMMDWDALRRSVERAERRKAAESGSKGVRVPGTGRRVKRPGRNGNAQAWAKWRAGAWGTVPRWEWSAGPKRAVDFWLTQHRTVTAAKIAHHVEVVWGGAWISQARQMQVDPLKFGELTGRHVQACAICLSDTGLEIWELALPRIGVNDVLRILQREQEQEPRAPSPLQR